MSQDTKKLTARVSECFKITCKKCGSENVQVCDDRGWSDYTGTWGSIDLMCKDCPNMLDISHDY